MNRILIIFNTVNDAVEITVNKLKAIKGEQKSHNKTKETVAGSHGKTYGVP